MKNTSYNSDLTNRYYDELIIGHPKRKRKYTKLEPLYFDKKLHIVINKYKSQYTLLDYNLNQIDSIQTNPIINFITRPFKLKLFKFRISSEFRAYKRYCRAHHMKVNKRIKKMHKDMIFYLKLCPDADYNILELLRRNVTKINTGYANYQTACAEYLRELAKLYDGDPDCLPFDINFATTDNYISSNHKYISNTFISNSKNFIQDFTHICKKPKSEREKYLEEHRYTSFKPTAKSQYISEKKIELTQDNYNR